MLLIANGTWLLLPSQHYILLALSPPNRPHLCKKWHSTKCMQTLLVLEHRPSPASLSRESGRAGFGPGQVMLGAGALGGPVGDGLMQVLQGSLLQGVRPEGACATGPQEVLCVLQEAAQASEAGHIHVFPHQPHLGPPEGHSRRWVPERAVKSGAPAHGELSLRRKYKSRSLQLLTSLPPQPLHAPLTQSHLPSF